MVIFSQLQMPKVTEVVNIKVQLKLTGVLFSSNSL